jgi:hypothetical protein
VKPEGKTIWHQVFTDKFYYNSNALLIFRQSAGSVSSAEVLQRQIEWEDILKK